jgi:hypothetical protein
MAIIYNFSTLLNFALTMDKILLRYVALKKQRKQQID